MTRGRGVISRWAWRAYDAYDRFVYPGTDSPAEQWQRIELNAAVDAHIARLDPTTRRAAEISGENHRSRPWHSYESLDVPRLRPVRSGGARAAVRRGSASRYSSTYLIHGRRPQTCGSCVCPAGT